MKTRITEAKDLFLILALFGLIILNSCGDDNKTPDLQYSISFDKTELLLEVEGTERLKATILPATTENTAHTWSSEDSKIASVDETGLITAHSVGTTKIVARLLANNSTAVCEVSVVNKIIHVQSVQHNSKVETLAIGDAVQLTATISPSNATQKNVTWSSQNPDVASVDDNGLVKAVGVGETEIKASADNKTAACKVTVIASGGNYTQDPNNPHGCDEPRAMRDSLVKYGVPWGVITLDYDGTRTLNSIVIAKEKYGLDSVLIISQKYHNERAIWQADHYGLHAVGYNAAHSHIRRNRIKNIAREFPARVKLMLDMMFNKKHAFEKEDYFENPL